MLKYIGEGVNYIQGVPKRDLGDEELAELLEKNPEAHAAVLRSGFWEEPKTKPAVAKPKEGEQKPPAPPAQ